MTVYGPSIHLSQPRQIRRKFCAGHLRRAPPSAEDPGDYFVLAGYIFSLHPNDGTEVSAIVFLFLNIIGGVEL